MKKIFFRSEVYNKTIYGGANKDDYVKGKRFLI